jgi:hypothetical protein
VQEVEAAHTKGFSVRGSKPFCLLEGISPGDRGVDENVVGKVGVDLPEGFLPLLRGDFFPEDAQTNGVAQLMPVEWGKR